ncbi:MAG: hypothetical protein LBJ17_06465 [Dysgonamonadaceae bacterium]|jgi:hypothetical protein|nr:hypothetical protein [Dysgonamonadaceae bacterium]
MVIRRKYSALSPARISLSDTVTEPLPTYTHTGKAITPIPVMYYEGKELVFAGNFSVTYKKQRRSRRSHRHHTRQRQVQRTACTQIQ